MKNVNPFGRWRDRSPGFISTFLNTVLIITMCHYASLLVGILHLTEHAHERNAWLVVTGSLVVLILVIWNRGIQDMREVGDTTGARLLGFLKRKLDRNHAVR